MACALAGAHRRSIIVAYLSARCHPPRAERAKPFGAVRYFFSGGAGLPMSTAAFQLPSAFRRQMVT